MDERRYYGLDALRGAMMVLGIVLHAAWLYLSEPPPTMPMPTERNNAYAFNLVFDFIHSFRMPTFFLLAGFFAMLLAEKRGLRGMALDRMRRVLAPLAAAIVLILPITGLLMIDFMLGARFGTHDFIPNLEAMKTFALEMAAKGVPVDKPALAHLWFLYYLCFFYLLVPLCQWLLRRSLHLDGQIKQCLRSPLLLVALTLYTALTLWPFRAGQVHEGFVYFMPHVPSLVYYGSFFALGCLLHQQRSALPDMVRRVGIWALLAAVMFPLSEWASHLDRAAQGTGFALHPGAVLANALCTWALIFLMLGYFLRYFDRPSPWIVYLSQSAYWVYLVHLPLVFLAGWWLLQFDLPSALKFALVCGFTALAAFLSFHYAVQKTWIGQFLHGRRLDLAWPR